jgi:DNA-binding XRE family transcriptional regulator
MDKEKILRDLELSIKNEQVDKEYIGKLDTSKEKVAYLRIVKGYTQERTAELIGIGERHVRRLENEIKYKNSL